VSCLRNKLSLDYPDKDGSTLRDTLLSVKRQAAANGKTFEDPRLELPIQPVNGWYVWDTFWSLNSSRGGTGYGPAPISCGDILDWIALYKQPLETWEIDALRAMDRVYLSEVQKLLNEEQK